MDKGVLNLKIGNKKGKTPFYIEIKRINTYDTVYLIIL